MCRRLHRVCGAQGLLLRKSLARPLVSNLQSGIAENRVSGSV